jgi:hypothetical protein
MLFVFSFAAPVLQTLGLVSNLSIEQWWALSLVLFWGLANVAGRRFIIFESNFDELVRLQAARGREPLSVVEPRIHQGELCKFGTFSDL